MAVPTTDQLASVLRQAKDLGLIPGVRPDAGELYLLGLLLQTKVQQRAALQALIAQIQTANTTQLNAADAQNTAAKAALAQANTDLTTLSGSL